VNSSRSGWNYTPTNEVSGGNTVYLDRHNVNCGNKPIADFLLNVPGHNQMRYQFRCSNLTHTGECRDLATPYNEGGAQNVYLDRHDVSCGAGEALTQFNLERHGDHKRYRYRYKCCKMPSSK
jgi:hypothetical protein